MLNIVNKETGEILVNGELTDKEWAEWIEQANPKNAIIERGIRWNQYFIHCQDNHGKQGGSHFAQFAKEYFDIDKSEASHWKQIGVHQEELCNIITQFANDWSAFYLYTTCTDAQKHELIESDKTIDQTRIRHVKQKSNRIEKQESATENALSVLDGVRIDQIIVGDFRETTDFIPDNSVDLVFIDPPYDRESIPLYEASAEVASRILKPGGHLMAYCGTYALPEILDGMGKHLRYFWMNACIHSGQLARMNMTGLVVGWKPIVWYIKGTRIDTDNFVNDFVSGGQEKSHHDWQQAESEAQYYIEKLCPESGLVVDFFCGGGTTGAVAEKMERKWLMFEINESTALNAMTRIKEIRDGKH